MSHGKIRSDEAGAHGIVPHLVSFCASPIALHEFDLVKLHWTVTALYRILSPHVRCIRRATTTVSELRFMGQSCHFAPRNQ